MAMDSMENQAQESTVYFMGFEHIYFYENYFN